MTIAQRLSSATYREQEFELRRQCGDFFAVAHLLMSARGDNSKLKELARESGNRAGAIH